MTTKTKPDGCAHSHLHFEHGSLYLVCDECKYVYAAVGHCPGRIIQDYRARSNTKLENQYRSDPLAPPRVKPSFSKK